MASIEPEREVCRLRALATYDVLDTPPEADFDDLTQLAADICHAPIALVSLLDSSRQWFKARVGVELKETPRELAFCNHALDSDQLLEVENATLDARFAQNPLVTGEPFIRFYAGVPLLTPEGHSLGTLCVVDRVPRTLGTEQRHTLKVLARLVMHQLELRRRLREQLRIEEKLRESERRFHLLADTTNDAVWEWDLVTQKVTWNRGFETLFGINRNEIEPTTESWYSRIHPDDCARVVAGIHRFIDAGRVNRVWEDEYRFAHKDGSFLQVRDRGLILVDANDRAVRMIGGMTDLTAIRRAEQALLESSALLEIASDAARIGGWKLDLASNRLTWSDAVRRIHEVPTDYEPDTPAALQFYPPADRVRIAAAIDECCARGTPFDLEMQIDTARGNRIWVRAIGRAQHDASGNVCAVQGGFQDIDDRKRREEELDKLGTRLQSTLESISDALLTLDHDWCFTYINPRAEQVLQRSSKELLGKNVWDEFRAARDSTFYTQYHRAATTGETVSFVEYYQPLATWFDVTAYPTPEGLAIYFRDINERVMSGHQLQRQALLLDQATDAIIVRDLEHHIRYWNRSAEKLYGWRSDEVVGRSIAEILYAGDRSEFLAATQQVRTTGEWSGRLRQRSRNGAQVMVEGHWTLISEAGEASAILAINTDIGERLELEQRLAQAQKLETIGQLTGGVAHDFNNLLTVIIGNAELLSEFIEPASRMTPIVELLRTAADRGAELTNRLLAFARRQTLEPGITAPADVVNGVAALLRRTLGEGIEVELLHDESLWNVFIDQAQLESALLNLCVNARDAMPAGGRLTIRTANVVLNDSDAVELIDIKPGRYVQITVADNGCGIAPELLARVVEPFFTTKPKGKGTGLGLSMVYGFVKQSGGAFRISSQVQAGTIVYLYLPSADGDVVVHTRHTPSVSCAGGREHILLVEDDALVRDHVVRMLGDLGYAVTEAGNGVEALALLQRGLTVDLLFTDVIMPGGLNGPQLAAKARELRPGIAVLFTSGYTENAINRDERVDTDMILLRKPYQRQMLAEKIRQALRSSSTVALALTTQGQENG